MIPISETGDQPMTALRSMLIVVYTVLTMSITNVLSMNAIHYGLILIIDMF